MVFIYMTIHLSFFWSIVSVCLVLAEVHGIGSQNDGGYRHFNSIIYLFFEWLLFSHCSRCVNCSHFRQFTLSLRPVSPGILCNTGASFIGKIAWSVNYSLFSIPPGWVLFSVLVTCYCFFLICMAWYKLRNISSVNCTNILKNYLFFLLGEKGKLCFARFLLLSHCFMIFVLGRMHQFRMLISRLRRWVWWLTSLWSKIIIPPPPLLPGLCVFWEHAYNF